MNVNNAKRKVVKVSVCVVTYNQKKYLNECLKSLVEQQTDFPYEIIVGDDASTDGSREVIQKYVERYPDLIYPVFHKINVGPIHNYFSVHSLARGEYVCHLDGDDVALPGKLKKQAAFLDGNPNVSVAFHRMRFFNEKGLEKEHPLPEAFFVNRFISRRDIILFGTVGIHSSMIYRKGNFSRRYEHFNALDWLITLELMGDDFVVVMPEVLGKYRVHPYGMSGGTKANAKIRRLFVGCQLEALKRWPEYASIIALRALFVAGLDLIKLRPYFFRSALLLLRCRSAPAFHLAKQLTRFYKFSHLPREFV